MSDPCYILATEKPWHDPMFENLVSSTTGNWIRVSRKDQLLDLIKKHEPKMIFLPHWSHLIPSEIIINYKCVIFHMTDLPYGRGGSPLQNLILNGKKETMVSALLADKGLDTGDVFLKKGLSLSGSAQEIFHRSSLLIEDMILEILKKELKPMPQMGDPVVFKRRTPEMSDISSLQTTDELYDYIRMLDADGYPHAYIETNSFKLEFRNASKRKDEVIADVRITKK